MNETPHIPDPSSPDDRVPGLKQRFKFRHVNEITGTFVILIVLVLIAAVVWMGHSQRWFKSRVTLRIILPETGAAGIRQGSEVYFLGTLVGSVSDVNVDVIGHMEAETKIRRDFFQFVRADSSAVVKRKFGVAGDSFFEISRGKGKPLREQNASIVCNEQFQSALEAAVEEVRRESMLALKKVNGGLETWTTLGSNLITSRERLDQIFVRANGIATDLQEGKGTVGRLLTDSSAADDLKTLFVNANHSIDELQVTLKNFQQTSGNLQVASTNLPAFMDNLQVTLKQLRNASGNLESASTNLPAISDALGNEAKDLPGLVLQTQTSMRELERLIEAMQRHWLLRKHVNKTNPPPPRPLAVNGVPEKKPMKPTPPTRDSKR